MRTIYSIFFTTIFSLASVAAVTQYSITYQGSALSDQDRQFAAAVEASRAKAQKERADFIYQSRKQAIESGAGSFFEYSGAVIRLIEANFAVARADLNMKEAQVQEKANELQMEWELGTKKINLPELAEYYVQLREIKKGMAQALLKSVEKSYKELEAQQVRMDELASLRSVSPEEHNAYKTVFADAGRLVELAKQGVLDVEKQIAATKLTAENARKEAKKNAEATTTPDSKK